MKKRPNAKPRPTYDPESIEKKWQKKWASSKVYRTTEKSGKPKAYILDMFPYPSGEGLHVGHPKGYIATDVVSRMMRMQGMNVLHPMGFDAFGLPAENYAIKTKTNPDIAVKKNVARYKKQLEILGFDYDWAREVNTTDPVYYKWTQWIFLQMWKKGLAYESNEPINWCPSCKTGLANEDVEDGRCERCGTPVEKKPLRQWVLKITDYADRLLADLDATSGIPMVTREKGVDAFRMNEPVIERWPVVCIIKHWSENKYLCVNWKATNWKGFITGGIEDGETVAETAIREVQEETGYKNVKFIREIGKVDSRFYQVVKKINRLGHFTGVYLELTDGERGEVSAEERQLQDDMWIPYEEVGKFVTYEDVLYIWDLFTGEKKQEIQPLLDWPEAIKESQRNWIGRSEGAEIDFRIVLKTKKIRFVIIHGYQGSSTSGFKPWLKTELEKRGHEVQIPELPNSQNPKESEQVDFVIKNCHIDDSTVVIGHSLGAIVAMKVMMKLNKPISGLVLVAPAIDPKFPGAEERPYSKTFSWGIDYSKISELALGRVAVLSDTREKFRSLYLKYLSTQLKGGLIEVESQTEHFRGKEEPAILASVTPDVKVFTTRADTILGVTYVVLAPEHFWVSELAQFAENKEEILSYVADAKNLTLIDRTDAKKEKTGVQLKGVVAINPANNAEVPIWIADYVLADYGTGAVMAVPSHDERDAEFSKKFSLPIIDTKLEDKEEMTKKFGKKVTKYKLKDWVFSRQRYWGEPIPLIHCEKCGVVAVPEKDLPVKLPKVKSYEPTGTGESPLAAISKWVNVKCPQCGGKGKRETNTMPQWAGSSWYYLRYQDPMNKKALVDPKKEKYWSPVDLYVGGAEHATRHLIYARFWHKFLYDIGAVSGIEPFKKLQSVGLIMGEDGRKMSKRFGNVVNPDEIVGTYGADSLRIYEMFMGPFDQQIAWSTSSMVGSRRFIERIWKLADKVEVSGVISRDLASATGASTRNFSAEKYPRPEKAAPDSDTLSRVLHKAIKKVSDDIHDLKFNTAISTLMITSNELEKVQTLSREDFETFLKLLAPFAPHVTDELWTSLGNKKSIHVSSWPIYDPKKVVEDEVTIMVQVNGKTRSEFKVSVKTGKDELENMAKNLTQIKKWTEGKDIKKVIVVPGRLVNIVV